MSSIAFAMFSIWQSFCSMPTALMLSAASNCSSRSFRASSDATYAFSTGSWITIISLSSPAGISTSFGTIRYLTTLPSYSSFVFSVRSFAFSVLVFLESDAAAASSSSVAAAVSSAAAVSVSSAFLSSSVCFSGSRSVSFVISISSRVMPSS